MFLSALVSSDTHNIPIIAETPTNTPQRGYMCSWETHALGICGLSFFFTTASYCIVVYIIEKKPWFIVGFPLPWQKYFLPRQTANLDASPDNNIPTVLLS